MVPILILEAPQYQYVISLIVNHCIPQTEIWMINNCIMIDSFIEPLQSEEIKTKYTRKYKKYKL